MFLLYPSDKPGPFKVKGENFPYKENGIGVETENKIIIEYVSLKKENTSKLPQKTMEKARVFICGVLNGGGNGIIYFGVEDSSGETISYNRGQIIGLEIQDVRKEINNSTRN